MLSKTEFVQQPPGDPSCFACAAAMAAGKTLEDFKQFIGRDSNLDRKGYSHKECAAFLLENNMCFSPMGYVYNNQIVEEVPGVELKATIDADTMQVLTGYAEQLGMSVEAAVNGILTRALTKYGARTREGYRYVKAQGHAGKKFGEGFLQYIIAMSSSAIVLTDSYGDFDHALYWDGSLLWDSAVDVTLNPVSLDNYNIVAWMPVGSFSDHAITPMPNGILYDEEKHNELKQKQ